MHTGRMLCMRWYGLMESDPWLEARNAGDGFTTADTTGSASGTS